MNWPCTRCGSRDWPRADTSCPLCYKEEEIEIEETETEEEEP
jgi:NMD protein affecting ribosome stability and mRNA decay